MSDYILILTTLVCSLLAYWFCGHCIAVARNGGPGGDGYESYRRADHPLRFRIYVVAVGFIGLAFSTYSIFGFIAVWKIITAS